MKIEKVKSGKKIYMRIRFRHLGNDYRLPLGSHSSSSELAAEVIREQIEADIKDGSFTGDLSSYKITSVPNHGTFEDKLSALPDSPMKSATMLHLSSFGTIRTQTQARKFIDNLTSTRKPFGPLNTDVKRKILSICSKADPFLFAGIAIARRSKPRDIKYFNPPEIRQILSYFHLESNRDFYPIVLALAQLGLRPSEALALNLGDINFETQVITISHSLDRKGNLKTTKTGRSRSIRVSQSLLDSVISPDTKDFFCPSAAKSKHSHLPVFMFNHDRLCYSTLRYKFDLCLVELGLEHHSLYSLRRALATNARLSGANDVELASMMGHSVQTANKYYIGKIDAVPAPDIY